MTSRTVTGSLFMSGPLKRMLERARRAISGISRSRSLSYRTDAFACVLLPAVHRINVTLEATSVTGIHALVRCDVGADQHNEEHGDCRRK